MKFGKETVEKCHKFDMDMSEKERAILACYGLKQIKNDEEALINYAVNKILINAIKKGKGNEKN